MFDYDVRTNFLYHQFYLKIEDVYMPTQDGKHCK